MSSANRRKKGWATVPIQFTYVDVQNPKQSITWKDPLSMRGENGKGVTADVLYGGNWPFRAGDRSLLTTLKQFENAPIPK